VKCKLCGKGIVIHGRCNQCGKVDIDNIPLGKQTAPLYGNCEQCFVDGRNIHTDKDDKRPARYLCFDCYEKERLQNAYTSNKSWIEKLAWYRKNRTEEELYLICARKEYVAKRQFVGKQPDWLMVKYWEARTCQAEAKPESRFTFETEINKLKKAIEGRGCGIKENSIGIG
jgi:hypothetical protein